MENAQDVDHILVLMPSRPEEYEVTPSSSKARNVYGRNAPADVGTTSHAQDRWAIGERFQSCRKRFRVSARLRLTKIFKCPRKDLPNVIFGGGRQANWPMAGS